MRKPSLRVGRASGSRAGRLGRQLFACASQSHFIQAVAANAIHQVDANRRQTMRVLRIVRGMLGSAIGGHLPGRR